MTKWYFGSGPQYYNYKTFGSTRTYEPLYWIGHSYGCEFGDVTTTPPGKAWFRTVRMYE